MADAKKKCFVISPIGDPSSAIRAEADWLLNALIRPALEPDFEVERADAHPKSDVITNQVILAIQSAHLIVADLTGHNPNVFYELAVAHAFQKPVVPMINSGQSIPFDNHLMGTIMYSRDRYEVWEQAKRELQHAAKETQKSNHKPSNPITLALGIGQMRASGDDKDTVIAGLADTVEMLSRKVDLLNQKTRRVRVYPTKTDELRDILRQMYALNYQRLKDKDQETALANFEKHITTYEENIGRDLVREEIIDEARGFFGSMPTFGAPKEL